MGVLFFNPNCAIYCCEVYTHCRGKVCQHIIVQPGESKSKAIGGEGDTLGVVSKI